MAAHNAKVNANIFRRILSPMINANIILIAVNHLNEKIETGFIKSKAEINYLRQSETIPGGKTITYLTNTLVKLEAGAKLETDKEYGIKGFYVDAILAKSRSATAGIKVRLVFDQDKGIDNVLTNMTFLRDRKRIKGSPRWQYLEGMDDVKFSLSEFKEVYETNEEFRDYFNSVVQEELMELITNDKDFVIDPSDLNNDAKSDDENDLVKDMEYIEDHDVYEDENGKYFQLNDDGDELIEVEFE